MGAKLVVGAVGVEVLPLAPKGRVAAVEVEGLAPEARFRMSSLAGGTGVVVVTPVEPLAIGSIIPGIRESV